MDNAAEKNSFATDEETPYKTSLKERWSWFKVLTLHRCWRTWCWRKSGFNIVGRCDKHQREAWNNPTTKAWLESL